MSINVTAITTKKTISINTFGPTAKVYFNSWFLGRSTVISIVLIMILKYGYYDLTVVISM